MPPVELAKLWALRVVLMKQGEKWDQYQWMGEQVTLVGGGHPSRDAGGDSSAGLMLILTGTRARRPMCGGDHLC